MITTRSIITYACLLWFSINYASGQNIPLSDQYLKKAEDFKTNQQPDSSIVYYEKASNEFQALGNIEMFVHSYNQIGIILTRQDEYDKAKIYLEKALSNGLSSLDSNNLEIATTYISLGVIYNAEENYNQSLIYHYKALSIRLRVLGKTDPQTATSYGNIGNVYLNAKEYDKSIDAHLKAMKIREKVFGKMSVEIIESYRGLGNAYREKKEYKKALEYFSKALDNKIIQRGTGHPDLVRYQNYISEVYFLMDDKVNGEKGQETNKENTLTLSVGPASLMHQDLIFSPFIHSDFSLLNLGLEYKRESKLFQTVGIHFANFNPMVSDPYDFTVNGEIKTAYPHSFNLIDLDYQVGKTITENQKSAITVGGLFSTDIQVFNYVYGRISSLGYYSGFGLGVFGTYQRMINKKSNLVATLQLPILAWLARSPYLVNDDEFIENISSHSGFKTFMAFIGDGQMVTWNKMQTLDLEIKYTYSLSEKWELGAAYLFEFIHVSQPRNMISFRNSLNISANFRF